MAFSGNNQSIYNAAYDGFLAGALAGKVYTDETAADYATLTASATAFATEQDSVIATDPELSTGAGGTTVPPTTNVLTQNQLAKVHLMFSLCFGYWSGRFNSDNVPSDYTNSALAIKAVYTEAVAGYANAPGGTSLT
jgi:hypothetical protein